MEPMPPRLSSSMTSFPGASLVIRSTDCAACIGKNKRQKRSTSSIRPGYNGSTMIPDQTLSRHPYSPFFPPGRPHKRNQ
ncbi:hypothetical protein SAMN05216233_101375 [Desulfoluna spongiiphila]|uniref:Uncharacterized protein n=1 Tax=Desulfoluna spongiiphila TaxID=419481 RepID=A0A1G5AQC5_9BACT|nr:hypothetical protein SAMN05216233_101375 [Desulfoluna spongiiphila]